MLSVSVIILLSTVLVCVFIAILAAWLISQNQKQSATKDVKTQRIVQKLYSTDLQRRAFIIHRNDGKYQVVLFQYSDKVVKLNGEVAGWQARAKKPVVDELFNAVEIANSWNQTESEE